MRADERVHGTERDDAAAGHSAGQPGARARRPGSCSAASGPHPTEAPGSPPPASGPPTPTLALLLYVGHIPGQAWDAAIFALFGCVIYHTHT